METWLNYQIDYLSRMFKRQFTKEEILVLKWFLSLDKTDKEVLLAIFKRHGTK